MEVMYLFYNFIRKLHLLMLVIFVNVHKDKFLLHHYTNYI